MSINDDVSNAAYCISKKRGVQCRNCCLCPSADPSFLMPEIIVAMNLPPCRPWYHHSRRYDHHTAGRMKYVSTSPFCTRARQRILELGIFAIRIVRDCNVCSETCDTLSALISRTNIPKVEILQTFFHITQCQNSRKRHQIAEIAHYIRKLE